jgi:hypothetical protein
VGVGSVDGDGGRGCANGGKDEGGEEGGDLVLVGEGRGVGVSGTKVVGGERGEEEKSEGEDKVGLEDGVERVGVVRFRPSLDLDGVPLEASEEYSEVGWEEDWMSMGEGGGGLGTWEISGEDESSVVGRKAGVVGSFLGFLLLAGLGGGAVLIG